VSYLCIVSSSQAETVIFTSLCFDLLLDISFSDTLIHIQSMAAAAAVVFAGKPVATATISFWINKAFTCLTDYCKAEGLEDLKDKVLQSMTKVRAVLDVVSPEHMKEQSSRLDEWLWQFRDAVEEAEDVIDELVYYELREKAKDLKVSDWGSHFSKVKHKVVKSVRNVSILDKTLKQFTHRGILKRLRKKPWRIWTRLPQRLCLFSHVLHMA
jgi:predicted RNase H-like nuclease (RuvC/YqgF family)